jgi:hypothetical protein
MKALHNILLSSCSCSSSYTLGFGFGFVCLFVCCLCVQCKCGVESWAASRGSTPVLFLPSPPQSQLRQFGIEDF